jgi:pimeloyl-ACP methyl ester carboxylesterase
LDPDVLHKTLLAAGEAGPFIIAGHSAGGQIAQVFAGLHPTLASGIALLDAYNDVAIALQYSGSSTNETVVLPSGRRITRPQLNTMNAALQSITDALRAITPFGWARFITMKQDGSPYRGQINAAYGESICAA